MGRAASTIVGLAALWIAVLGFGSLGLGTPVHAFGTVGSFGQHYEHERITRWALACGRGAQLPACFDINSESLTEIAGRPIKGINIFGVRWGAVGAPDNPARGLITTDAAHCDNGDYYPAAGRAYPQTKPRAQAHLEACRNWIKNNLVWAVGRSSGLLNTDGSVKDSEMPTHVSCTYTGHKNRAKCDVLEYLGLSFHALQDFYSHSNWVDQKNPAEPEGIANPPGMKQTGPAPWLDFDRTVSLPDGLITGCFQQVGSKNDGCPWRVRHGALNKDTGVSEIQIPMTGEIIVPMGSTPRGKLGANFRNAVQAAIADTRAKFEWFYAQLVKTYGQPKAATMICAITHDDPAKQCKASH